MKNATSLRLPSWAGYRAGKGTASDGVMRVSFHGKAMTPLQREAILDAGRRDAVRHEALVDAILAAYPTFRPSKPRPKSMTRARLASHVELWEVKALNDQHQGIGYVAYSFSCSWDPSGIVLVTHGDRVVAAGGFEVLEYPIRDPMRTPPELPLPSEAQRRAARVKAEKHAKKNPKTLRFDDGAEEMSIVLPCWAGFVVRPGAAPSTGGVLVTVCPDSVDEAYGPAQEAAYRRAVDRAEETQRVVLDAIVASFEKLTRHNPPEVALPKKVDRTALRDLVALTSVHLHGAHRDGVAYVGYELGCRWDREHALGVMTHLDSVVKVGGADTAILGWIAARDRDRLDPPKPAGAARKAKPAAAAKKPKRDAARKKSAK